MRCLTGSGGRSPIVWGVVFRPGSHRQNELRLTSVECIENHRPRVAAFCWAWTFPRTLLRFRNNASAPFTRRFSSKMPPHGRNCTPRCQISCYEVFRACGIGHRAYRSSHTYAAGKNHSPVSFPVRPKVGSIQKILRLYLGLQIYSPILIDLLVFPAKANKQAHT